MNVHAHLTYSCHVVNDICRQSDNKSLSNQHLLKIFDDANDSLWFFGLVPLCLPDPLSMNYQFEATWNGFLDVSGCIIGGDGTGGPIVEMLACADVLSLLLHLGPVETS